MSHPLSSDHPAPTLSGPVVLRLAGLFFLSRLLVLGVAALTRLADLHGPYPSWGASWMDRFVVWDATWYLKIATTGYDYNPHGESAVAFYPLYPLLIRAGMVLGLDARVAGYAVSYLALLGAVILLWKLAAFETRSAAVAERAVTFLLFCPGAMWFGLIYTESLFLLTLLGCLLAARQGRWLWAGLCGAAAALTRTPGLLLAGFLLLEAAQQWAELRRARATGEAVATAAETPLSGRRPPWFARLPWNARVALGIAGPVLGHLAFLLFLQLAFGDWRAQQKTVAASWDPHGPRWPWISLPAHWRETESFYPAIGQSMLAVAALAGAVSLFTLRRLSYPALTLGLLLLYATSTTGESLTRYVSTTAPIYLVLAQLAHRSRLLDTAVLVFSAGLMVLLTALLVGGYRII